MVILHQIDVSFWIDGSFLRVNQSKLLELSLSLPWMHNFLGLQQMITFILDTLPVFNRHVLLSALNNVHHNSPEHRLLIYYRYIQRKAENTHIQQMVIFLAGKCLKLLFSYQNRYSCEALAPLWFKLTFLKDYEAKLFCAC